MLFIEQVLAALNAAQVRYVVVGGIAVVLHGVERFTTDLDLVVDLAPHEALKAIEVLSALGLRPRVPVDPRQFADTETRQSWIDEKNMKVFAMIDYKEPTRVVDVFVKAPLPFEELWSRASILSLKDTPTRVAAISDLIQIKRDAGRPQDWDDVRLLRELQEKTSAR